eukprot:155099-Pelagomonas_calceolata.AAC.1
MPSINLNYATPPLWEARKPCFPRHSWSLLLSGILQQRVRLNENNPAWLSDLAQQIPEAQWKKSIKNDPVLNARHPSIETGFKLLEKLPSDQQQTPKNIIQSQQTLLPLPLSSPDLVQKVQNWKKWAYTYGSCHIHHGGHVIVGGLYHPNNDSPNYVQPTGAGIINTIVRAESAAIAATILQGHAHIATDGLSSLHQIRKQALYPELRRQLV